MMILLTMNLFFFLILLLLSTTTAAAAVTTVTDFVLVDATTGKDLQVLQDGSVLRHSPGNLWTVRAEVTATSNSNSFAVQFDLDEGRTQRVESVPPYLLAGKSNSDTTTTKTVFFESNALVTAGYHVLTAFPVANATSVVAAPQERGLEVKKEGALTVRFTVLVREPAEENGDFFFQEDSSTAHLDGNKNEKNELVNHTNVVDDYDSTVFLAASVHGSVNIDHNNNKVTIGFQGPVASETGTTEPGPYRVSSTFADYRLDCHFQRSDTSEETVVPGFYTATTNAALTGARAGPVWLCIFQPPLPPTTTTADEGASHYYYKWRAVFVEGTNVAANGGGDPAGFFHEKRGSFEIITTDAAPSKQPLRVVNNSRLVLRGDGSSSRLWAIGPNAPTLLRNLDGAATIDTSTTATTTTTTNDESPVSKMMNGLQNLSSSSSSQVTSIRVATYMLSSSSDNESVVVSPFVTDGGSIESSNKLNYDVSALAQWQQVLEYASNELGLIVVIQLSLDDDDNTNVFENSEERKLYAREMVARFGHLPYIVWELGTTSILDYFQALDPYDSPILVTTSKDTTDASMPLPRNILVQSSGVVTSQDNNDAAMLVLLWKNLLEGRSILHLDVGSNEDFGYSESFWQQSANALNFLAKLERTEVGDDDNDWQVVNDWVSGNHWCTALDNARTLILYKHQADEDDGLRLTDQAPDGNLYSVEWFDPVNGSSLIDETMTVGAEDTLSSPNSESDWLALLRCINCN